MSKNTKPNATDSAIKGNNVSPLVSQLIELAKIDTVTPEKIDSIVKAAQTEEEKAAERAYIKAMAAFSAEDMEILKTKLVSFGNTNYKHAQLSEILDVVDPFLCKHGLTKKWVTKQTEKDITVTCIVTHLDGHSESSSLTAPPDTGTGMNNCQKIVSTKTYLRRDTLVDVLGMAAKDEDDDGRGGNQHVNMPDEEFESWKKKIKATKTKADAEKITVEIAAACKKYNDLDANTRLRGVYTIHVGKLAK